MFSGYLIALEIRGLFDALCEWEDGCGMDESLTIDLILVAA